MNYSEDDVHTLPGKVLKYYPDTQLADIILCAEKVFTTYEEELSLKKREPILGVPVHICSGGGYAITFPIKEGDTCLVVFSQTGYDHWLYNNDERGGTLLGSPVPHLRRKFSEDDGFAMVGFNTLPKVFSGVSSTDSEWRNSDKEQYMILKEDGSINIKPLQGKMVTVEGDLVVQGNLNVALNVMIGGYLNVVNDAEIGGISFLNHTHGSSPPPQ